MNRNFFKSFIFFFAMVPAFLSAQFITNTPALSVINLRAFVTASNMASIISNVNMTNLVDSNYGARFVTVATDKINVFKNTTNKFTNALVNYGNHPDTFLLKVVKTNSSVAKGFYWFTTTAGVVITNLGPIPRFGTNKFVFNVVITNGSNPNYIEYRLAAGSMMGTSLASNYIGDAPLSIAYGGDIAKQGAGLGFTTVNSNPSPPHQNNAFIRLTMLDTTPPATPILHSILSNHGTNSLRVNFSFSQFSNKTMSFSNYLLQVDDTSPAFANLVSWTNIKIQLATNIYRTNLPVWAGTRYWRVSAYNKLGVQSLPSSVWTFTAALGGPSAPIPVGPRNGIFTNSATQNFIWDKSIDVPFGITNYRIIFSSNNWTNIQRSYTNHGPLATNIIPPPLGEAVWVWRVLSQNKLGNWSSTNSTRTNTVDLTPPLAPTLIVLKNTCRTNTGLLTFRWTRAVDAVGVSNYSAIFSSNNWATTQYSVLSGNSKATNLFMTIGDSQTWVWKVRGIDKARNLGAWSGVQTFLVDTGVPGSPFLRLPKPGQFMTNHRPNFAWGQVTGASNFILFINGTAQKTNVWSVTNYQLTAAQALALDGNYTWFVRAIDIVGNKTNSGIGTFSIDTTGPTVTLQGPKNVTVLSNNPILYWTASDGIGSGVSNFKVFASNVTKSSQIQTVQMGTSYQLILGMPGVWTWWVVGVDRLGNSAASVKATFTNRGFTADVTNIITISDVVHTVLIPFNGIDTTGKIADNADITITVPVLGDINGSSIVDLIWGLGGTPSTNNKVSGTYKSGFVSFDVPQKSVTGKEGQVFYFKVIANKVMLSNKGAGAAFGSWGFTLGVIKEQENSVTVVPTVITRGGGEAFNVLYTVAASTKVNINVYTISGDLVRKLIDETKTPGSYVIQWDGKNIQNQDVGRGLYFIIAQLGGGQGTIRKVVVK